MLRKLVLRQAQRYQEFFLQNLSRVNWSKLCFHVQILLMVIINFNVVCAGFSPDKTYAPLVVDPD